MNAAEHNISSCRHCLFYQSEGRRGGQCQQLGVKVQGQWQVCSLAASPFSGNWRKLEKIVAWQSELSEAVVLETLEPIES